MNVAQKDVIIAEDDADDLLIFELAIKDTQVPVAIRHAENGDVLFVLLKDRVPELLFLDIHMPCKDGISCIREIRQSKDYDDLPIIMFSSDVYKKTVEECFRNGANFYLVKPTSFTGLSEKLKKILSLDWEGNMHYPPLANFLL
jgi:CheY-like chemotaxis protein